MPRNKKRPPAGECAVCGSTLEEVGGRRVVCGPRSGIALDARGKLPDMVFSASAPCRAMRVPEAAGGAVIIGWGEASTREAVERAAAQVAAGLRPWVCMRCDGPLCRGCGSPLTVAVGRDVLEDDGGILHVPLVAGFGAKCSNPDCDARFDGPVMVV